MLAYTDGRYVYMSEDLIKNRRLNYKIYTHEVLHIALLHTVRAEMIGNGLNKKVYNILADHRINNMLAEKIGKIDGGVYNLQEYGFDKYLSKEEMEEYNKYSVDYLYSKMRDKSNQEKNNDKVERYENDIREGDGEGSPDGDKEGKGDKEKMCGNKGFNESEIREMLNSGVVYARSMGSQKGSVENCIENYCNKVIDWSKVVINNTYSLLEREADWSRINKKSYITDYPIMPRRRRKEGVKLLIGVDTSGSMNLDDISSFMGSLINLVKSYGAELDVMEVDSEKQLVFNVKSKKDLERVDIKGRGGTSFNPFIEYIKEHKTELAVLFTDGYGDQKSISYIGRCKVFWVISNGGCCDGFSFGKVMEMR
jgi:predicted metal-dependent peptidase